MPTTSFAQNNLANRCSTRDGVERVVGDATECFRRHMALGPVLYDGRMGALLTNTARDSDDAVVVRALEDAEGAYGAAFFPEHQACVLILSEEFDIDAGLDLVGAARGQIGERADDDCWIEFGKSGTGNVAVAEFLGASSGVLVSGGRPGTEPRVLTITDVDGGDTRARSDSLRYGNVVVRWSDVDLLSLLDRYIYDESYNEVDILSLGINGFLVEVKESDQTLRILVLVRPRVEEFEVCAKEELKARPSPSQAFEDLLQLDDREIAMRTFRAATVAESTPATTRRWSTTSSGILAYTLCRRR